MVKKKSVEQNNKSWLNKNLDKILWIIGIAIIISLLLRMFNVI